MAYQVLLSPGVINPLRSFETIQSALKRYCEERIRDEYRDIFNPAIYRSNGLDSVLKDIFESETASITLLGPPGIGKSTSLCSLAMDWSQSALVYLTDARELEQASDAFKQTILDKCCEITDFDCKNGFEMLKELLSYLKVTLYIFVDNVELVSDPSAFYNAFNAMQTSMLHDRIRFLNTCDDTIFFQANTSFYSRFTQILQWPDFSGAGFTNEEYFSSLVKSYFSHFEFTTELTGKAREWCRIPLFLRLFADVYKGHTMQRAETLKLKYLFDRYIATFCQKIAAASDNCSLDSNVIANFIEQCALLIFEERSDTVPLDRFNQRMARFPSESITALQTLLADTTFVRLDVKNDTVTVHFTHILFRNYITARALVSEMNWYSKDKKEISGEITGFIRKYDWYTYLPGTLQAIYLLLEFMNKNDILIEELLHKKYGSKYRAILLRCFAWQNEMTIPIWEIIRQLECDNDRQITAATTYLKAMLFEQMPDDCTMELFGLPKLPVEKLQTEMVSRLRFDSTLSRLATQFRPYCHLSQIQEGILRILDLLEKTDSRPLLSGLLSLIELVLGYDLHKGIELMKIWQKHTQNDVGILNCWCDISCRNAVAIFPNFWETYVKTCMNDRQGAQRIILFSCAGGQSAPAIALTLIQKFWQLNTNIALREKIYSFINDYGIQNAPAAIKILVMAKKETDTQSLPHKLEIREQICKTSIACFEKSPIAFKPLIQEWLTHDDVKLKMLVAESVKRVVAKKG